MTFIHEFGSWKELKSAWHNNAIDRYFQSQKNATTSIKDTLLLHAQPTEEQATEVNSKTLSKATKPPVNIKSFFKRIDNKNDVIASKTNDELVIDDCAIIKDIADKAPKLNGAVSSCDLSSKKTKSSNIMTSAKGTTSKRGRSKNTSSGPSLKRTLTSDSAGTKNKRQKQSSIFTSLGRTSEKTSSVGRGGGNQCMTCPICGKSFDEGTSNAEVNIHVDNCLIE